MIRYCFKQVKIFVWHFLLWHWRALLAGALVLALLVGCVFGLYRLLRERVEVQDGLTQSSKVFLQDITLEGNTLHYTLVNKGKSCYRTTATLPALQKKIDGEWELVRSNDPTGPVKSDFEGDCILIQPKAKLSLSQDFSHVVLDEGEYRLVYDSCMPYDLEAQEVERGKRIYAVGYFSVPAG